MKTFCRGFATCVFGLSIVLGATAESPAKPPSFLKVGSRYTFYFTDSDQSKENPPYGEIVEFGPGPWMRVQFVVPDSPWLRRSIVAPKDTPPPGTKLDHESWFNFSRLTAVIPAEKQAEGEPNPPSADTPTLPKVGASYFFGSGHPYFGKVIEIGEDGWFRVREMNPRFVRDAQSRSPERDWWINSASLSRLTEAKPKDLPE
jgi:hypothetical protein